jgi:hypothetical protein
MARANRSYGVVVAPVEPEVVPVLPVLPLLAPEVPEDVPEDVRVVSVPLVPEALPPLLLR